MIFITSSRKSSVAIFIGANFLFIIFSRIRELHLCSGVRYPKRVWPSRLGLQNRLTASLQRCKTPRKECPGYDTKQSAGEASVMQELWGMQSTPSLPSLPGTLRPGLVALVRVLNMGQFVTV